MSMIQSCSFTGIPDLHYYLTWRDEYDMLLHGSNKDSHGF